MRRGPRISHALDKDIKLIERDDDVERECVDHEYGKTYKRGEFTRAPEGTRKREKERSPSCSRISSPSKHLTRIPPFIPRAHIPLQVATFFVTLNQTYAHTLHLQKNRRIETDSVPPASSSVSSSRILKSFSDIYLLISSHISQPSKRISSPNSIFSLSARICVCRH